MRAILAFVFLLAAAKFGYQEYAYRSALVDTLVNTYRQDAVESCHKVSKERNLAVGYAAWSEPESLQLVVGRGSRQASADVSGETTPEAGPILVIVARKAPDKIQCEFDIVRMSAAVYQL